MKYTKYAACLLATVMTIATVSCSSDEPDRPRVDSVKINQVFKYLGPKKQKFEILPGKENTVTAKKGTRLIIPANSFNIDPDEYTPGEKITLSITEIIDRFDFASSGVSLTYYNEKGEEENFESAGMFSVEAVHKGERIDLAEGKKISVQFPNVAPGDKYKVYFVNDKGQWQHHGHNQEELDTMPTRVRARYVWVRVRLYEIDGLKRWNFDYPNPKVTCVKGKITGVKGRKSKSYHITTIGVSYRGYFSRWVQDTDTFKINVHRKKKFKIIVVDENGFIGVSKVLRSGNKPGFDQKPEGPGNYCKDIGKIRLKPVKRFILSNRRAFLKYIGLPDKKYRVKYPKEKPKEKPAKKKTAAAPAADKKG
ncbi:MAG: hypothetical protein GY754_19435 [bacterium]|nr:hypothetical protein [bacterium]